MQLLLENVNDFLWVCLSHRSVAECSETKGHTDFQAKSELIKILKDAFHFLLKNSVTIIKILTSVPLLFMNW